MTAIAGYQRIIKPAIPLWLFMLFSFALPAEETATPVDYRINTEASILRVYVGKAGVLAGIGHNHVIANRHIRGTIVTDDAGNLHEARLIIPSQQFSVDETGERQRAGTGFETIPAEKDRLATRNNMLGPAVLNTAVHPEIIVNIAPSPQEKGDSYYPLSVSLAGAEINLALPAVTRVSPEHISVESHFILKHHDLGLEPYSALAGMLRVAEDIRFELILEAGRLPQQAGLVN